LPLDQPRAILEAANSELSSSIGSEDIPNLDFLRACAVFFVLIFHLILFFQKTVPGPLTFHMLGHWGVLIFFVHTSLVLALSLERQALGAPGRPLFWPFLVRRVFRILPLSIFVVCVVEFCGLPVGHLHEGKFVPVHLNWAGLLSNIFLVQNLTQNESATAPLWSLPYEMQMYLLLPLLFLLVRSAYSLLTISCLWVVGFIALRHEGSFARHGIPDFIVYVPYFLPGIIAYRFMAAPKIRLPSLGWPVALGVITAFYLHKPDGVHAAFGCLLLGVAIPHFAQISRPSVIRISQTIARYSYGVYLTHFICIWFAFQALAAVPKAGQWAIFVLSASVLPFVLYHLIEAPMIQLGRRIAQPRLKEACLPL
jgi:peptidoglycan/LPS O-acetylase OafA/YrhL